MKKIIFMTLLLFYSYSYSYSAEPIRIGMITNVSGENSRNEIVHRNSIELAAEEINARGGILGRKLELIIYDNEGTSVGSKLAAERAVSDGIVALLGCGFTSYALAAGPVLHKADRVMIVSSATNPAVTKIGENIFRVCFTDDYLGSLMAKFGRNVVKAKRASMIVDIDTPYSIELGEYVSKSFRDMGGEITRVYKVREDDKDFKGISESVKKDKPDIVYVLCYTVQTSLIIKQFRKNKISSVLIGGDSWTPLLLRYNAAYSGDNYYFSGWSEDIDSEKSKAFVKKYRDKYGDKYKINDGGALSYDSLYLLSEAIERAKSTESAKIRKSLQSIKDFTGVTGKIEFDSNRNPKKKVIVNRVKGSRIVFVSLYQ